MIYKGQRNDRGISPRASLGRNDSTTNAATPYGRTECPPVGYGKALCFRSTLGKRIGKYILVLFVGVFAWVCRDQAGEIRRRYRVELLNDIRRLCLVKTL